jgi:hypothetical protein
MAEKNIVGGMFGITPEMYQRSIAARDTATNANLAALAPGQLAGFYAMEAGSGLGRAAQGLLGVEDPELAKIRDVQQMRTQFDVSTPTGLRSFAQALGQKGYTDLAVQAAAKAADIDKELSIAEKNRTEKIKQVGLSSDGLQVYQSGDEQFTLGAGGVRNPYYGKLESKTAKTEVNLGSLGDLFAKNQAKEESKDVVAAIGKAKDLLSTGAKLSRDIDVIDQLLPNSFQGQFANWSKTASKTLSGLGVPVSDKASNTETLNALFTNFVLPAVKQLPGSLAAKELDFLRQSKPETLQEPATIRRLVGMLKEDIAVNRALVKRADAYQKADKLNSLQGFNIALEQDNIYTDLRRYNALKQKVQNKQAISKEEADFAKSVEKELGL